MTLIELCEDVSELLFDGKLPIDARLRSAAQRALNKIFADCGFISYHTVIVATPTVSREIGTILHKGGSSETLPVSGRAYSMYVSGKGQITVSDKSGTRVTKFDDYEKNIKGFISGEATVLLEGNYDFVIKDLTLYSEIFGDDIDEIPDSREVRIDMRSRVTDFIGFAGEVYDADGKTLSSYRIIGSSLILPEKTSGRISVPYYRSPRPLLDIGEQETIDLPSGCENLISLLCAYFVLLEDEPALAEAYLELYKSSPKPTDRIQRHTCLWESNGWA